MPIENPISFLFKLTAASPQLSATRVKEGDIVICEDTDDGQKLLMTFSWARTEIGKLDPTKAMIYFNVENVQSSPRRAGQPSTTITLERDKGSVQAIVRNLKTGFNPEDIINKVIIGTNIIMALMDVPVTCRREVRDRLGYQYYDGADGEPTTLDFTRVLDLLRAPKKQIKIIS